MTKGPSNLAIQHTVSYHENCFQLLLQFLKPFYRVHISTPWRFKIDIMIIEMTDMTDYREETNEQVPAVTGYFTMLL